MIREIEAKSILSTCKNPSQWFGVKYNLNIYRGCEFQCIYCDSRSECYGIENFSDLIVKTNAIDLLRKELASKRIKGTVGTGAMSDPYTFSERKLNLTRRMLETIAEFRFPVHITTKSNLILRDIEILEEINKIYASVSITITTINDELAQKVEPFAPLPSERLKAIGILSTIGICTSITMMPILPFIQDNEENIVEIIKRAKDYGVRSIVPFFGMTLRDRQRVYYYQKLDEIFPGHRQKYEKRYGLNYNCFSKNYRKLNNIFSETCYKYGISSKMPSYENKVSSIQLSLFEE
jgi:DNA repair photolyase